MNRHPGLPVEDQDLARRLESALTGADQGPPVDLTAMTERVGVRARRARVRRTVVASVAAATLVAVPVAAAVEHRQDRRQAGSQAVLAQPELPPSPLVSASARETASGRRHADAVVQVPRPPRNGLTDVAWRVPSAVALSAADLGGVVQPVSDSGQLRLRDLVADQGCPVGLALSAAGRQWVWTRSLDGRRTSVTLTVTGWAAGSGEAAFGRVARCRSTAAGQGVETGAASWRGTAVHDGWPAGTSLVRSGDLVVAVSLIPARPVIEASPTASDAAVPTTVSPAPEPGSAAYEELTGPLVGESAELARTVLARALALGLPPGPPAPVTAGTSVPPLTLTPEITDTGAPGITTGATATP